MPGDAATPTPRMTWQPELEQLRHREALARRMGGPDKVKRQHEAGRLTVRERIEKLADPGSFHEIGTIAGKASYDDAGRLTGLMPSNCVWGRATLDGRRVVLVGNNFTARSGSADATIREKPLMAERMANEFRMPTIRIIEGSGGGGSVKTIETTGRANLPGGVGGTGLFNPTTLKLSAVPVVGLGLGSVAGLGAALLASGTELAQPADRPARIVVGFAPGGTTGITARIIAEGIAPSFGHRGMVDTRTGANGFIAAEAVAQGPADGSQVLLCPMRPMTISPEMPGMHLPIDVVRDLVPVANVARSPYVVVTGAGSPYRTLPELIEAARARPGALTYASAAYGQAQHLSGERLKCMTGIDMVRVPYRGAAPAALDVIAGRADLLITNLGDVIRQIQGGQLRLLAMGDREGWPEFPGAPRLPDILPGLEVIGWFGVCGPRGLSEEVLARWAAAMRGAFEDPVLSRRLVDSGLTPNFEDPATFARTVARDRQAWGEVIRAAGIRAQ